MKKLVSIIFVFIIGLGTGLFLASAHTPSWQNGNSDNSTIVGSIGDNLQQANPFQTVVPKDSPKDRLPLNAVAVYQSDVVLDLQNATWATFTDTHSMEPVISAGASALEIVPSNESDLKVGDIVAYKSVYADGLIIHRIVYIGTDDQGTYFIMKGDNLQTNDPGRVRFSQIQDVVVAIVY